MIIKRKLNSINPNIEELVNVEEKLFTKSKSDEIENLLNLTEGIGMEIMKAIEFYKLGEENVNHWLSVAAGNFAKANKKDY